jgi:nucleotide-binding universal stress UspA family protein
MRIRPPVGKSRTRRGYPSSSVVSSASHGPEAPPVIVVCVDGSAKSFRAVAYAAGVARRQNAVLVGVYLHRPIPGFAFLASTEGVVAAATDADRVLERRARDLLSEESSAAGVEGTLVVRSAGRPKVMLEIANEWRAEALIVAASGRGFQRVFPTFSGRLLRRAGRPVIVVP